VWRDINDDIKEICYTRVRIRKNLFPVEFQKAFPQMLMEYSWESRLESGNLEDQERDWKSDLGRIVWVSRVHGNKPE
jgi:hypothetical protein